LNRQDQVLTYIGVLDYTHNPSRPSGAPARATDIELHIVAMGSAENTGGSPIKAVRVIFTVACPRRVPA
jgi:hypothetical protein